MAGLRIISKVFIARFLARRILIAGRAALQRGKAPRCLYIYGELGYRAPHWQLEGPGHPDQPAQQAVTELGTVMRPDCHLGELAGGFVADITFTGAAVMFTGR
jgi:hypothetical protein